MFSNTTHVCMPDAYVRIHIMDEHVYTHMYLLFIDIMSEVTTRFHVVAPGDVS